MPWPCFCRVGRTAKHVRAPESKCCGVILRRIGSRWRLKVQGPDGLKWTVRRLVLPLGVRPYSPTDVLDLAVPRRLAVHAATGPLPLGFVLVPLVLPFLPIVLLLRRLRVLPWTLEARTYPWGRRFPPIVFHYEIRGRDESARALAELAEALARGDGGPVIAGAERVD